LKEKYRLQIDVTNDLIIERGYSEAAKQLSALSTTLSQENDSSLIGALKV